MSNVRFTISLGRKITRKTGYFLAHRAEVGGSLFYTPGVWLKFFFAGPVSNYSSYLHQTCTDDASGPTACNEIERLRC